MASWAPFFVCVSLALSSVWEMARKGRCKARRRSTKAFGEEKAISSGEPRLQCPGPQGRVTKPLESVLNSSSRGVNVGVPFGYPFLVFPSKRSLV